MQSIFIPFQQLDNAITRAEGTGLGLTISQRLVKLMGSKLEVKSALNKGCKFWFDLDVPALGKEKISVDESADLESATQNIKQIQQPDIEKLESLLTHTKRHNILGIRSIVKELEEQPELAPFLETIRPYIESYRFKELAERLEKFSSGK